MATPLFLIPLASLFCFANANAASFAKVIPLKSSRTITAVQIEVKTAPIEKVTEDKHLRVFAVVTGKYERPEWNLIFEDTKVVTSEDGTFEIKVPLEGQQTVFQISAIGPRGEIEKGRWGLLFPEWLQYLEDNKPSKRHFFIPGLSISRINYKDNRLADRFSEPGKESINETVLTGKLSYLYLLSPGKWDLGITTYGTLLPITNDTEEKNNISPVPRFIGVNFRVGYVVPQIRYPWRLSILGGLYYTSMFGQNSYGFQHMTGPQLFPVLERRFKKGNGILGYFKFSPVADNVSLLSVKNREIAFGLTYFQPLKSGRTISFSLDISNIYIKISQSGKQDAIIEANTYSLGVGYPL